MQHNPLTEDTGQIPPDSLFVSGWAGYPCLFPGFFRHARFIQPFSRQMDQDLGLVLHRTWKTVFAWSLGAHICLKNLKRLNTDRLVLIAPFLDFCAGTPREEVKEMIQALDKKPESTVRWFWKACAVKQPPRIVVRDVDSLRKGLEFLIHSRVDQNSLNSELPITLIHGLKDRIVPVGLSEKIKHFLPQICCQYVPYGHFIPETEILNAIR